MKKIILLSLLYLICFSFSTKAQSELPETSTNDDGPWYYIQVLSKNGDSRKDRVFSVVPNEEKTGKDRVMGVVKDEVSSIDDIYKRLWRFEEIGEGVYIITNRYTKKGLSYWQWEETGVTADPTKYLAVVEGSLAADWKIEASTTEGYFQIIADVAETDDVAANPYLHQGNATWNYGIILEIPRWGSDPESFFQFVKYEGAPALVIDKEELNFGYRLEGEGVDGSVRDDIPSQTFTVFGFPATGEKITVSLKDEKYFFFLEEDWTTNGGKVNVWFYPGAPGECIDELTISSVGENGPISKTVTLKGTSLAKIPVTVSPAAEITPNDTWYYIQFPLRTGYYMQSKELNTMLEVTPGHDEEDPSHLWKFVLAPSSDENTQDTYFLINKLGHQLIYKTEVDDDATADRFYSANSSDETFGFVVRPTDGHYQIQWNGYYADILDENGEPTGETEHKTTYINKTNPNTDNGFTQHISLTDVGNAVKFIKYGTPGYEKLYDRSDWDITTNIDGPEDATVGGSDPFYIIDEDLTTAFAFVKPGITYGGIEGPADYTPSFTIDLNKNLDINFFIYRHRTDNTSVNLRAKKISIYGKQDGSENFEEIMTDKEIPTGANTSEITLVPEKTSLNYRYIKVDILEWGTNGNTIQISDFKIGVYPNSNVGIETPETNGDINGVVVDYVYYTLQGIQLTTAPKTEGLYIQKTIYLEKKATAKTIYIK